MAESRDLTQSKVFCILPWLHLQVRPNGRVYPCCSVPNAMSVGNFDRKSLVDIAESEPMNDLRKRMLSGQKSKECSRCYELEDAGSESLRLWKNSQFSKEAQEAAKSSPDGKIDHFVLKYMDVRFSNVCNFKCRICGPQLSSAWYDDAQRLSPNKKNLKVLIPRLDRNDLLRELKTYLPNVEEICFAGGEPLVQQEHYIILDELIQRRQFHLRLHYNTNFSFPTPAAQEIFEKWSLFENVEVAASLDAMGEKGEYLRKGQNWQQTEVMRKKMIQVCPKVKFKISPTLSAYNVLALPDLHRSWIEKGLIKPQEIFINILSFPFHQRSQILPLNIKKKMRLAYDHHINWLHSEFGSVADSVISQFNSCVEFTFAENHSELYMQFLLNNRALDKIRNEKLEQVFAEFSSETT